MARFTFVSQQNPDGRSGRAPNRKACDSCRVRKRRCYHQREEASSGAGHIPEPRPRPKKIRRNIVSNRQSTTLESDDEDCNTHQQPGQADRVDVVTPSRDKQHYENQENENENRPVPQFVGDLNPVARLLDQEVSSGSHQDTSPGGVGVWVQPVSFDGTSPATDVQLASVSAQDQQARNRHPSVSDIVAVHDVLALSRIYFSTVHSIIPLLNEDEYQQLLGQGKVPTALCHAVCLVASKDEAAIPHLRLIQPDSQVVPVKEFCAKLHASIMNAISRPLDFRKITLIRILALLSLHQEGFDGAEQASSHLVLACHHAQSLAIHLHRPRDNDNLEMKRVFWCLWTLDRLNAAINSRPCFFHDIDIAVDTPAPGELGFPAFDAWFAISRSLSRAIDLYRPGNPEEVTGIEVEYPEFEQLVTATEGMHLPQSTLATLRIFHLTTMILAFRLKTIKTLPVTTSARLRQQLSAIQIVRQMKDSQRLTSLHPLPVIVYGASLALSVSYQQLRFSQLALDREEALEDFRSSCDILQTLRRKWSSSDPMATLAQRVLNEVERLPNLSLIHIDRAREQNGVVEGVETHQCAVSVPPDEGSSRDKTELETAGALDAIMLEDPDYTWNSQTDDLFDGMDNLSWMYLAAENPFNYSYTTSLDAWSIP